MSKEIEQTSVDDSIIFIPNPVRPFMQNLPLRELVAHDCQQNVKAYARALGAGRFAAINFTINRCAICGLGFTEPIPSEDTAHLLYESRESNDFQPNDSPVVAKLKAAATRRDVRSFIKDLVLPEGPLLDFGCGNAAFATAMMDVLPDREVVGADLQEAPPQSLSADRYIPYPVLFNGSARYAFIVCRHVLEHSYNPVDLLSKLFNLLRPGGVLVLEVPSLETAVGKVFGKYWDNFYVPYHPIHFTREALRATVLAAGFSVTREGGSEMPKMGRSLHNLVGGSYHIGLFAVGMLLQPLQIGIGLATGTSVCLRIWGQRPFDS